MSILRKSIEYSEKPGKYYYQVFSPFAHVLLSSSRICNYLAPYVYISKCNEIAKRGYLGVSSDWKISVKFLLQIPTVYFANETIISSLFPVDHLFGRRLRKLTVDEDHTREIEKFCTEKLVVRNFEIISPAWKKIHRSFSTDALCIDLKLRDFSFTVFTKRHIEKLVLWGNAVFPDLVVVNHLSISENLTDENFPNLIFIGTLEIDSRIEIKTQREINIDTLLISGDPNLEHSEEIRDILENHKPKNTIWKISSK